MNKEGVPLGPRPAPTTAGYPPLSRQRLAVLDYVRTHAPVRIAALAAGLDLHPNTVREHLDALLEYRLVERLTEAPTGRGRPAALYRPTAADPAVVSSDYAGLATALAGHLARTSATPERDARSAGVEWGRELVADAALGDDPRGTVLDVLSRLGFAPEGDGAAAEGIALRACPLLDAARRYPTIVCQVHLGIIEGILDRIGAVIDGDLELVPFAEPGACRLFLPNPVVRQGDRS